MFQADFELTQGSVSENEVVSGLPLSYWTQKHKHEHHTHAHGAADATAPTREQHNFSQTFLLAPIFLPTSSPDLPFSFSPPFQVGSLRSGLDHLNRSPLANRTRQDRAHTFGQALLRVNPPTGPSDLCWLHRVIADSESYRVNITAVINSRNLDSSSAEHSCAVNTTDSTHSTVAS